MTDVIVQLSKPIQAHGEEVTELTIREPTVKDLRAVSKITNEMDSNLRLAELLTGLPTSSMDQVTTKDYACIQKVIGDFLDDGQETGESC
jgi:hypothetical protein